MPPTANAARLIAVQSVATMPFKTELAERMVDMILEDLLRRGAEVVSAQRPIVAMLVSVFRVP